MRRFFIILLSWLALSGATALAGSFPLTDGSTIVGTPDSIVEKGVVFQLDSGDLTPRTDWDRFTPDALRELLKEAKTDAQRALVQPMVDNIPSEVAKRKEIVIQPIDAPFRPKQPSGIFGLFGSPAGWFILLVLYAANLFAAYEVCVYRRQPLATVCGLAAIPFFGVLSPIIYGAMPTQRPPAESSEGAPAPAQAAAEAAVVEGAPGAAAAPGAYEAAPGAEAAAAAAPAEPAKPALPEPVVFSRGEYSFNRRFFETKFAGFFRLVPSEAEKDLVLRITASRGQFTGRRIVRITPNELYLQVFKNEASSEEMIPFAEISEVQIRHKDSV